MKLAFRDLKQQKFTIEAEPSETIGQVKEKISKEKGWEASTQKLIYSGKILTDDNTVESYKIEEKGFIVCMLTKPKAAPATTSQAAPSTPAPPKASTPAPPPAPQPASTTATNPPATPSPAPAAAAPASASPAPPGATFNDPSALLVGEQAEGVYSQMEAMGFARSDIDRAMRAAFHNPDRAVDYLLNGIPDNVLSQERPAAGQQRGGATAQSPPAQSAPTSTGTDEPVNLFEAAAQAGGGNPRSRSGGARGAAAASPGAGEDVDMDFLRDNPHFQQLRQLVQQSPAMLEPILQQVAEGNPELARMIGQNQEQFLQLLSEDLEGGEGQGGVPPGGMQIEVTTEERDAIERLCRLGFPRDAVIQAYFACDKNEELAANYLFEQPDDDDH